MADPKIEVQLQVLKDQPEINLAEHIQQVGINLNQHKYAEFGGLIISSLAGRIKEQYSDAIVRLAENYLRSEMLSSNIAAATMLASFASKLTADREFTLLEDISQIYQANIPANGVPSKEELQRRSIDALVTAAINFKSPAQHEACKILVVICRTANQDIQPLAQQALQEIALAVPQKRQVLRSLLRHKLEEYDKKQHDRTALIKNLVNLFPENRAREAEKNFNSLTPSWLSLC